MRLHRFYVDKPIDSAGENSLSDAGVAHQLRDVFRLRNGDKAVFFDGSGTDSVSEIVSISKEALTFRVLETKATPRISSRKVVLAVSLIKKDNFEWVIQKGTELGVSEFIPLVSDRSEKKGFNIERARKIMIEACEQSGRGDIPVIREQTSLKDFLDVSSAEKNNVIAFHTEGPEFSVKDISNMNDVVACIGPEGGWTDAEIDMFKEKGDPIFRLKSPILRAETAAVAIASLLLIL